MRFERSGGILLHPTSLPGPPGIGDLGPAAHRWLDDLASMRCGLWQTLPLGPTGYADSPYQSFSSFAGNPNLISPDLLVRDGYLDDVPPFRDRTPSRVDYGSVIDWKTSLLDEAFRRAGTMPRAFVEEHRDWLEDYAMFMTLKDLYGGLPWTRWPAPLRDRDPRQLTELKNEYRDQIDRHMFVQHLFFSQWSELRSHAAAAGVRIIGDLPIFVAHDSADVWANRRLFALDDAGQPEFVAGVPPDYFSPTGQLWGNPQYRWDVHASEGYQWWIRRIARLLDLVDIVRIDHFRAFADYWEIPGGAETAETGRWVDGPGTAFFDTVQSALGDLPVVAEDLGQLSPKVPALRDHYGFPGMRILQFGFEGDRLFLPDAYPEHSVAYTGTHDNDTLRGWYEAANPETRRFAEEYLQASGDEFVWAGIEAVWRSRSVIGMVPLQDLLDLGSEARMNTPGTTSGNWQWRADPHALTDEHRDRMAALNRSTRRAPTARP